MTDPCDYCGAAETTRLRLIGFTTLPDDDTPYPQAKGHCGVCLPDDRIDPVAVRAFLDPRHPSNKTTKATTR